MKANHKIMFQIDSHLEQVADVGSGIRDFCHQQGMDEMNSYQVQTAVTEAINNAILYACESQPGHQVTVTCSIGDETLSIEVRENGKSMQQIPPDIEPSVEAESGRGWWIMRRWMDRVDYIVDDGVNCLILKRKI